MASFYPEVVRILWISLVLPGVNLCAQSNLSIVDLCRTGHFFGDSGWISSPLLDWENRGLSTIHSPYYHHYKFIIK